MTDANGDYAIADLAPFDAEEERREREEAIKRDPKLEGLRYGPVQHFLYVNHPDFATRRANVTTIPGTLDVQIEPGGTIEGRVRLPEGETESLAGAVVHLQRDVSPPTVGLPVHFTPVQMEKATIDASGKFRFKSLPAGRYHLAAALKGWVTLGVQNVEAVSEETTTSPDILLTRGARLRVQLVDEKTGEPIRFDKPTQGLLVPIHNPPREQQFLGRDNRVEYSMEGVAEIRVPGGSYAPLISIQNEDGSALVSDDSKRVEDRLTFGVPEGELVEVDIPVRLVQPEELVTMSATFVAEPPSDLSEDEGAEEAKPEDAFVPAAPPTEKEGTE